MNETRELAKWAVETRYGDLPKDIIELAKVYALDDLASGIVGANLPWSNMIADTVRETGCRGESTVFLKGWKTTPAYAAWVNGTMIGGFETDHAYGPGSTHPSATVFPAALAVGEAHPINGREFLAAIVVGYEAICRIGDAATRAVEDKAGFHGPGSNAPFGSAIAASKVLGLDQKQMVNAIGIAASHAAGILEFAWEGAMVKRMHISRGAQTGVESALLAQKGLTGPGTALEGKYGFWQVYSPSPKPELLLQGLGKDFRMKNMLVKSYPCYGSHQAIIEGMVNFKQEKRIDPRAIKRVVVITSERVLEKHDDQEPTSIMGMQYSLPFATAVALTKDATSPLTFNEKTLWDKQVRELAKRVETVADNSRFGKYPLDPSAEITIELDGKHHTISVSDWKGSPRNPFNFEEMCGKLRKFAAGVISEKTSDAIIGVVRQLEDVKDLKELTGLLGQPS